MRVSKKSVFAYHDVGAPQMKMIIQRMVIEWHCKNWLYFLSTFGVHTERRLSDIFIILIMLNYVAFLLTKNSKLA